MATLDKGFMEIIFFLPFCFLIFIWGENSLKRLLNYGKDKNVQGNEEIMVCLVVRSKGK